MTSRFKEASELLKGSNATNWKLISITIDPDHDQLNILNDYRKAWEFEEANKWSDTDPSMFKPFKIMAL